MRRLVFITQAADPLHPALGATLPMLRALAERVDEVVVLTDHAAEGALPGNCVVRTFGAPARALRGVRFEAALLTSLRPRPFAVVAHMVPLYALLSAPFVRPLRIPLLLWYTHWHAGRSLRIAERAVTDVVSVDRRSFPFPSAKLTAIGHGIDLSEFSCVERSEGRVLRALVLGRYSPAKGLDVIVRGVAEAARRGLDVRLTMHGPASNALERRHRDEVAHLVGELELADRVELGGPIARAGVPALFAENDVLVNNMRAGAPDKAVYEACASCLPALASNPVFDDLLAPELRFARESPSSLADALANDAVLDAGARAAIGRTLREGVAQRHSVDSWADGILRVVQSRS